MIISFNKGKMTRELEKMCEHTPHSIVTYCQTYGKKDCPMTCSYAQKVAE